MMSHRILPAALLLCTLAACGQSPTGSDVNARPGGPSYDGGGYTIGSGNNAIPAGGGLTIGSGDEEGETEPPAQPASSADGGGYTIGSGN